MVEFLELVGCLVLSCLSQVLFVRPDGNSASGPGGRGTLFAAGTGLTGFTGKDEDVRIFGPRTPLGLLPLRTDDLMRGPIKVEVFLADARPVARGRYFADKLGVSPLQLLLDGPGELEALSPQTERVCREVS